VDVFQFTIDHSLFTIISVVENFTLSMAWEFYFF
jgi:hypothetical protein